MTREDAMPVLRRMDENTAIAIENAHALGVEPQDGIDDLEAERAALRLALDALERVDADAALREALRSETPEAAAAYATARDSTTEYERMQAQRVAIEAKDAGELFETIVDMVLKLERQTYAFGKMRERVGRVEAALRDAADALGVGKFAAGLSGDLVLETAMREHEDAARALLPKEGT